ncbi:ring domain [Cryptosporidium bovis]|uniref:ring domain n=1 Tax=Cryptosporidium bovis TaxID=310047 RepID=UPI00351A1CB5|nr:ring domain [Cryptosporidium bovis]
MNTSKSKETAWITISKFVKQNYRVYILENEVNVNKLINYNTCNRKFDDFNDGFSFEWNKIGLIDLIYKDSDEFISCPICMETDILVPKISSCGHIFCWPCIVKYIYFNIGKEKYEKFKCPICFSLASNELVSVRYHVVRNIGIGSKINLCLLFRKFSSCVVHYDFSKTISTKKAFFDKDEAGIHFQRIGFLSNITEILLCDLQMLLNKKFGGEINMDEELYYIDECISILYERIGIQGVGTHQIDCLCDNISLISQFNENELLEELLRKSNTNYEQFKFDNGMERIFYFYQCYDGQLIFLEPFYIKILQFEFGGIDKIPRVLLNVDVIYIIELILDEFTFKRYKFLSHLPMGSAVKIVGIDIIPLISTETKYEFGDKIEKRLSRFLKFNGFNSNSEQVKERPDENLEKRVAKMGSVHNHHRNKYKHRGGECQKKSLLNVKIDVLEEKCRKARSQLIKHREEQKATAPTSFL